MVRSWIELVPAVLRSHRVSKPLSLGICALVVSSGGFIGCGSTAGIPVYPVEGQLTVNGKPVAGVQVVFHPQNAANPEILPARASTDAGGNFKLTTYNANDGAAEGEYAVTAHFYPVVQQEGSYVPGPNVLPPKYAAPTTTDVKAQVAKGPNKIAPIDIKR